MRLEITVRVLDKYNTIAHRMVECNDVTPAEIVQLCKAAGEAVEVLVRFAGAEVMRRNVEQPTQEGGDE